MAPLFFGWFGWLKTLESDKSSRLLVRRMVEWLSGKTRPCNPQNSEPSPILPEMSGNKPSPTAGWLLDLPWFTQDAFESSPWPGLASGDLLFARWRSHPLGIVEDECIWCIFWPFLRQSKLMSPSFLRLKTRWPRLRHHRHHQQTSHRWPEENDHYLGGTGETPSAVIIRVELVRGWHYLILLPQVGEFSINSTLQEVRPSRLAQLFFGWFGWFKTPESDKSSRLLVRRMVEWLSGKTRPCNPQNRSKQ